MARSTHIAHGGPLEGQTYALENAPGDEVSIRLEDGRVAIYKFADHTYGGDPFGSSALDFVGFDPFG